MYIYKTEILRASFKWFTVKANEEDIEQLDKLINEKAADGWELVTYNYMATSAQWEGAFLITFRKEKYYLDKNLENYLEYYETNQNNDFSVI